MGYGVEQLHNEDTWISVVKGGQAKMWQRTIWFLNIPAPDARIFKILVPTLPNTPLIMGGRDKNF